MNNAIFETASAQPDASEIGDVVSEQVPSIEELTKAVAENALLNTEVDRKIAAHLLDACEEIKITQRAVVDLRQQFEGLKCSLAQVVEITRAELKQQAKANATPVESHQRAEVEPRLLSPERLLAMGANLKLNIGCGLIPLPDYFNVDARELPGVDMISDARSIPLQPLSVSEIYAAHLIEHFTEIDLRSSLLPSWHRMLKRGGLLRVVVPDAEGMIQAFSRGQYSFKDLREVTFGSQDYPSNYHLTMFSRDSLRDLLRTSGFHVGEYTAMARPNGLCLEMEIQARKVA